MAYGEPVKNIGTDQWDFTEFKNLDGIDLLARLIYSEAADQIYEGKLAVAHIAYNRILHWKFPDSYKEVILERGQFVGMTGPMAREPETGSSAWIQSLEIAKNMDPKDNPIGGRLFFGGGVPDGAENEMQIQDHYFYNVPAWEK